MIVQLAGVDLFFRAKIEAMLTAAGHEVMAKAGGPPPDLVIADVNRTSLRTCSPGSPVFRCSASASIPTRSGCGRRARRASRRSWPARCLSDWLPDLVADLVR